MKTLIFITYCLFLAFQTSAQELKQVNQELNLDYKTFQDISLSPELKLKDLSVMDKDFTMLSTLGTPKDVTYKDHVAYESWVYEYDDMRLSFVNQNGYLQVQSVTFFPKPTSQFRIGKIALQSQTEFQDIASFESGDLKMDNDEVDVFITSPMIQRYPDIHFKIKLDRKHKNVESILILFDTV